MEEKMTDVGWTGTSDEKMTRRAGVLGLGYVGLPLAVAFGAKHNTVGFDSKESRITELQQGHDHTGEVSDATLKAAAQLTLTSDSEQLRSCDFFVVAVPTPVDNHKVPDLSPVLNATRTIAAVLKKGDIVVYESTVYPGVTEELCAPMLEKLSGLIYNTDFFCGYSPERINPGDKQHNLQTITKVVSGSTPEALDVIDTMYSSIVAAGTYRAESIMVAEAAKVIENTQRDVNIALINELAVIFGKMGLDTHAVLAAAATKWNFLQFQPGLVGGHCIGVDPYYLTYKAQELGYTPEVILAGRRINDSMGTYVADLTMKAMARKGFTIAGSRVIVCGLTFKENCPDVRNTRVVDIIHELTDLGCLVDVMDPVADVADAQRLYGIHLVERPVEQSYDAVILAVAHDAFLTDGGQSMLSLGKQGCVVMDVKAVLPRDRVDVRL
jgi:UDP-N-acetyl-D-galactosamine dehydrogenase